MHIVSVSTNKSIHFHCILTEMQEFDIFAWHGNQAE